MRQMHLLCARKWWQDPKVRRKPGVQWWQTKHKKQWEWRRELCDNIFTRLKRQSIRRLPRLQDKSMAFLPPHRKGERWARNTNTKWHTESGIVLFTQRRQIWVMWKLRQNWHLQWILSPGQWHTYSVATSTGCFTCFQCIRKGRQEGMLARELGNIECVVREAGGSSLRTLGKELCDIKCTMATTEEGQKEHAQKL